MATYAYLNILLMERTAISVAPDGVSTQITIPLITVSGKDIRPRGFALAAANGNFSFKTGLPADLGDAYDIVAADLVSNAQIVRAMGATDQLWLEGTGAARNVTIRWLWAHDARDGLDLAAPHGVTIPTQTFEQAAPGGESTLVPPTGAMELVIEKISANAISYRVDNGTVNGDPITVDSADVTLSAPYRIYLHEDDRLRWVQSGGAATVSGYWRYTG